MKRLKYLVSISVTFSLILLLTFATPASALEVHIDKPKPRVLGEEIHFSLTIYIKNKELVPIQSVDLEISHGGHKLTCDELPLYEYETTNYYYEGIKLVAEVTSKPHKKWGYGDGDLQATWDGYGYSWDPGYGYGGYISNPKNPNAGPNYPLPTYITYEITWYSDYTWPTGDYEIKVTIKANGDTFIKTRTDKYK